MLIKLPRIDNKPPIIIKSDNIEAIAVFDLVFDIWFIENGEYTSISCPISVYPQFEAILDIVDLTKPQKDPF